MQEIQVFIQTGLKILKEELLEENSDKRRSEIYADMEQLLVITLFLPSNNIIKNYKTYYEYFKYTPFNRKPDKYFSII